jgi:hypothetical protein
VAGIHFRWSDPINPAVIEDTGHGLPLEQGEAPCSCLRMNPESSNGLAAWRYQWPLCADSVEKVADTSLALTCVEHSAPRIALVLLSFVGTMRLPSYKLTVKHQG